MRTTLWISRSSGQFLGRFVATLLILSFIIPPALVPGFLYADEGSGGSGGAHNNGVHNTTPRGTGTGRGESAPPTDPTKPTDPDHSDTSNVPPSFDVVPGERGRHDRKKDSNDRKLLREVLPVAQNISETDIVENQNTIKSLLPNVDTFTGSLGYNYSFSLPDGRNGMTPDLELTYNSGVAVNNGIAGYGWYFSIPHIERINRKGSDRLYSTSTFYSSLSGELVLVGNTAATSTYVAKTELGDFLKYELAGTSWLITDKAGKKYKYGYATTSSQEVDPTNSNRIFKWMIEEERDINDNFIRYEYTKNANKIYPAKIVYTGSGDSDGIFEVDFIYENRNDTITSYEPTFKVTTNSRVSDIQIKINSVLNKAYAFDYVDGYNGNRSLLSSIIPTSGTSTLPATEFNYQTMPSTLSFNPDVFQAPNYYRPSTTDYVFMELDSKSALIDVNGDGLQDFVRTVIEYSDADGVISNNNNNAPRVYMNTGSGWEFDPDFYQIPSYYRPSTNDYQFMELDSETQLLDVNGDNLPDFVHTSGSRYFDSDGIIPDNNDGAPRVYLNTGEGWEFDPDFYQIPSFYRPVQNNYGFLHLGSDTQLVDVNGDSLLDFVRTSLEYFDSDGIIPNNNNDAPRVYLNTGSGWEFNPSLYQIASFYRPVDNNYSFLLLENNTRLLDVNNDGLVDFVRAPVDQIDGDGIIPNNNNDNPRVYLNSGTGWQFNENLYQIPSYVRVSENNYAFISLSDKSQILDVNGDGLPEFVYTIPDHFDSDGVIQDLNNAAPRVYMNTGMGWEFSSSSYQLPSFYRPVQNNYGFMVLGSDTQFADVNSDSLPDFVRTSTDYFDSDGLILDNNNDAPRAYLNTGEGWEFSSSTYQIPSFYRPAQNNYGFIKLGDNTRFTDANHDSTEDFFHLVGGYTNATGTVENNNNDAPRVYINDGEATDYLSSVGFPEGGRASFRYDTEVIHGRNSSSPFNPQTIYTVSQMVSDDSLGNYATTSYDYTGGEYYYHPDPFKQFTGFNLVEKTDALGNVSKTYFHQGNYTATSTGEYDDHPSKIGKPYLVEQYDNSGNLFSRTINTWDKYDTVVAGGATSSFVKLTQTLEMTYDGDSDHKDKAQTFTYHNTTGNITSKTEYGEVTGDTDGTFSDTGSDTFVTSYTYATSTATSSPLFGIATSTLPARELVKNQAGATVSDTKMYYDTQAFGVLTVGNMTKQEMLATSTAATSTYIDIEKTYNSYGLVTQEKDPRDKVTTYTYDTHNLYPATTTNPLGHTTSFVYDYSAGKPTQVTDANGRMFQVMYDGFDRVIEEKQPDPASPSTLVTSREYVYNDNTFPTSIVQTDELSSTLSVPTYTYFDGLGRPIQERKKAEVSNTYSVKDTAYDVRGMKARESLPYFSTGSARTATLSSGSKLWNHLGYDAVGRIKTISNVVGTTTNTYDDWKLTVTDARGKTKDLTKDARGNLVRVDEKNGTSTYSTLYDWNGLDNLMKITDALGNVRNFAYDNLGRRTFAEDLHAVLDTQFSSSTYSYDATSNLISMVDGKGQIIQYSFDDINRPLTEDYTGQGGSEVLYKYDVCANGKGKLCFATTSSAVSGYTYDALGRMAAESISLGRNAYATSYEYDKQGNQTGIVLPDLSEVTYVYNDGGLVERIGRKDVGGSFVDVVEDLDYSPEGKITFQANANDTETINEYDEDALYRLQNRYTENGLGGISPVLQDISYTYDAVGNITEIDDESPMNNGRTVLYTYDDLSRLASASTTFTGNGQGYKEEYVYDPIGNFITKGAPINIYVYQGTTTGLYANPHAVTKVRTDTYVYDKNGNVLSDGKSTSTWNYNNRMTQRVEGATTTTYEYDHSGERVKYGNGLFTTYYPHKYWNIEPAWKQGTSTIVATSTTSHIFLGDMMVATVEKQGTTTTMHYHHTDHLSGAGVTTGPDGEVSEVTDYYPYGDIRYSYNYQGFTEQRKFTGHEYDQETDLTYMGARYYAGNTGRFRSIDPVYLSVGTGELKQKTGFELEQYLADPQGLNSYAYARNNPLKNVDRNGEWWETSFDLVSVALSTYDYNHNPSLGNAAFLGLDVLGLSLPIPAVVGYVRNGNRAYKITNYFSKVARSAGSATNLSGVVNMTDLFVRNINFKFNQRAWSVGEAGNDVASFVGHFYKHGDSVGVSSVGDYYKAANDFIDSGNWTILDNVSGSNSLEYWNAKDSIMAVTDESGKTIRSFYKADDPVKIRGYNRRVRN